MHSPSEIYILAEASILGFSTGTGQRELKREAEPNYSVFTPSNPTPLEAGSGFPKCHRML